MKEAIWKILPGFIRSAWSGNTASPSSGWFGNYKDWASASAEAHGYESAVILDKVRNALMKVKNGEAAYERDSVAFDKLDYDPVVLKWLQQIGEEKGRELSVLDFGGSLGSTYYQYKNLLQGIHILQWIVIEQPHFVSAGKKDFEDGILGFTDVLRETSRADVLLLFSVLPYIEHPDELIARLIRMDVPYIILDRTAVIPSTDDRITLQIVPDSVYKASYPAWFFSEEKLLNALGSKYDVLQSYKSKFADDYRLSDGVKAGWKGYILKKK